MTSKFVAAAGALAVLAMPWAHGEGPLKVPPDVQERKLMQRVQVVYPQRALAARISGSVRLTALIDKNGEATELHLLSGHPLLVRAAAEAVRKWRYRPTYIGGRPVDVLTTVEVPFVLPDSGAVEPPDGRC